MKTIFYQQNQLKISNKFHEGYDTVFNDPSKETLNKVVDLFLNTSSYTALLYGNKREILTHIKSYFKLVNAAGGLVINPNKEILLIKRLGKWDLPKGKLEKGESKQEGAIREVEEECGISNLRILKSLKKTYHVYNLKESWVLKTCYWYWMAYKGNEILKPQLEEDITEVKWENFKNAIELDTYPTIKDVLHQLQPLLV